MHTLVHLISAYCHTSKPHELRVPVHVYVRVHMGVRMVPSQVEMSHTLP